MPTPVEYAIGPEYADAHQSRIDVLERVKQNMNAVRSRPTPLIDAAIQFHRDAMTGVDGDRPL